MHLHKSLSTESLYQLIMMQQPHISWGHEASLIVANHSQLTNNFIHALVIFLVDLFYKFLHFALASIIFPSYWFEI